MATKSPKEFDRVMRRGQRPAHITPDAGRHLDSERALESALMLPIEMLSPDSEQPRKHFDQAGLQELADSILEHGMLQPLVVHRAGTLSDGRFRYVVVAGGRRYAAAQLAGLSHVPVLVRNSEGANRRVLQLTENLLREDLTPLEEARAMKEYMDLEGIKDRRTLAERIHKSHSYVEERFLWMRYADVEQALGDGVLTPTAATEVARVTHKRDREKLIKQAAQGPLRREEVRRVKHRGGGRQTDSAATVEDSTILDGNRPHQSNSLQTKAESVAILLPETAQDDAPFGGETNTPDAEFEALLVRPDAATTILAALAWARRQGLTLEQDSNCAFYKRAGDQVAISSNAPDTGHYPIGPGERPDPPGQAFPDEDMVIFSVRLPKALRRELRRYVAERDMTLQELVTEAIRERLAR